MICTLCPKEEARRRFTFGGPYCPNCTRYLKKIRWWLFDDRLKEKINEARAEASKPREGDDTRLARTQRSQNQNPKRIPGRIRVIKESGQRVGWDVLSRPIRSQERYKEEGWENEVGKKITQDMANNFLSQQPDGISREMVLVNLMEEFEIGNMMAEKFLGIYEHIGRQFNGMKTGDVDS